MADDTKTPTSTTSAVPAANVAASKPQAAKPAVKRRTTRTAKPAASKAASTRTPAIAKPATTAAKKTATRPKPAPATKAAQAAKPVSTGKTSKPAKAKKVKLVRDSFTMPDAEYEQIAALKKRCLNAGVSAKKSEILRAAVANLAKLSDSSLVAAVRRLEVIKTGRPAKGSK